MKKTLLFFILASLGLSSCSQNEDIPSVVAHAPLQYVLEDLSGTVLIQSAGETTADPASEQQTLQAGDEIITQAGAEATLTLNETTLFHISGNSDVKVDQLVRNDTGGFVSRLGLAAGKVLSEVEKLSKTGSTFEVESGGVICGVRGTAFEVEKKDTDVQTATYEGVVALRKDNNSQTVSAGQQCGYSAGQGTFTADQDLTPEQKASYEDWKAKAKLVRAKCRRRLAALRALDKMPPGEREKMLQQLNGVKGKDAQRTLLQMMRERSKQPNAQAPSQPSGAQTQPNAREGHQAPHQEAPPERRSPRQRNR